MSAASLVALRAAYEGEAAARYVVQFANGTVGVWMFLPEDAADIARHPEVLSMHRLKPFCLDLDLDPHGLRALRPL
jgi:hypothetical protein